MDFEIEYLILRLHDIAREVQKKLGDGKLAEDIRRCADRLADLDKSDVK